MTVKVSVILPVYNVEKYLKECLDSILNQTLQEIEVICVDDGSTDRSLEILREYEKKDKRVIVLTQENKGAGAARNKGLAIAKGEYLSFLDSDDFFCFRNVWRKLIEDVLRRKRRFVFIRFCAIMKKQKKPYMTRAHLRKRMHPEKMYFVIRICRIIY